MCQVLAFEMKKKVLTTFLRVLHNELMRESPYYFSMPLKNWLYTVYTPSLGHYVVNKTKALIKHAFSLITSVKAKSTSRTKPDSLMS